MGITIDLQWNTLACSKLHHTCILKLYPPGKGFPDGTFLDVFKSFILLGTHSNISSTTSSLQFITLDYFDSLVCQTTSSDDIVVYVFQCSMSRSLTYSTSSLPTSP